MASPPQTVPRLALVGLACAALALALMAPTLGERMVVGRDLQAFFYPKLEVCGSALSQGTIPRWNPYSGHGASHFGPRNGGVLYPGYALFGWLPPARAMAWFLIAHTLLAAAGAYRLARAGDVRSGALVAAVTYAGGGFLVSQFWATPYLISAAWLPWALLGGWWLGRGQPGGAPLLSLSVGLTLLTAEAQGAMTAGLGGLVVALWIRGPRRDVVARVAAAGALAAGLAALQVVSILVELPRTDRGLEEFADSRWDFAPLATLLDLLAGGAAGDAAIDRGGYWGYPLWDGLAPWCGSTLGAIGLVAAVSAARSSIPAARLGRGLVVVGLAAAVLRLGAPLHLRFSSKWWVLAALGASLLAAAGFSGWRRDATARRRAAWLLAGLAALTLVAAGACALGGAALEQWLAAQKPGYVDGAQARAALLQSLVRTGLVASLGAALCRLQPRRGGSPRSLQAGLLALLALELIHGGQQRVTTTRVDALAKPALAELLQRAAPGLAPPRFEVDTDAILAQVPFRSDGEATRLDLGTRALRELLQPNTGHRYGVRQITPFESVFDRSLTELQRAESFRSLPRPLRLALLDAELLLLTRADLQATSALRELYRPLAEVWPEVLLVRNLACPPFAYVVPRGELATSTAAAIARVADARRYPLDVAILGPDQHGGPNAASLEPPLPEGSQGWVELVAFEPERIELEAEVDPGGWVVVREAYHPDWRATLDGQPVPTLRADVLFRAVQVPAGRHTLTFRYAPPWWTPALGLNLLAWAAWLGLAALSAREALPPGSPPPPPR